MDWPYSFTPYSIKQAYSYLDEARSIGADVDLWVSGDQQYYYPLKD